MYIRFQGRRGGGIFHISRDLRDQYRYARHDRRMFSRADGHEFEQLVRWLHDHTPVPPSDAFDDLLCARPRCWFKESAAEHVRCAWRLIDLMRRAGVFCRPYRSRDPGPIIWEDDVQVIVRPHRTDPLRPRRPFPRPDAWKVDRITIRRWNFEHRP